MAGKGDKRRPKLINQNQFEQNWDNIFRKKEPKVGDIFMWSWNEKTLKDRTLEKQAGTLYWCCSCICVYKQDNKFYDTYWSSDSSNKRFTKEEATDKLKLKFIANFDELIPAYESDRAYYDDGDFVDITHPNMSSGGFYIRKGAKKSLKKIEKILKRNIKKLEDTAESSRREAEHLKEELVNLSDETCIFLVKGVSLYDDSYEDSFR